MAFTNYHRFITAPILLSLFNPTPIILIDRQRWHECNQWYILLWWTILALHQWHMNEITFIRVKCTATWMIQCIMGEGRQLMTSGPAMCSCKSAGMLQGLQLHPMTRPLRPLTWTGKGQNQQFWIIHNRYVREIMGDTCMGEHHNVVLLCYTHYSFINGSNLYVNKGCYSCKGQTVKTGTQAWCRSLFVCKGQRSI